MRIRIATRESQLALWQAYHVRDLLIARADCEVEIIGMTTQGDRDKSSPLSRLGGKGVFVKELEAALLEKRADIAVHSMKDVPVDLPAGLHLAAICEREDPRDALVANAYPSLAGLPASARVGSSSLRRRIQLQAACPHAQVGELRGNVDTRLRKLDEGEFDAIILAVAGLKRLGLQHRISEAIATDLSVPAAGQGAVGIECRMDDEPVNAALAKIAHPLTQQCVTAERIVTTGLGASCNLPIGVHAAPVGESVTLSAFISDLAGERQMRHQVTGPLAGIDDLAGELLDALLAGGAAGLVAGGT